jgi:hypothetical protein
MIQPRLIAAGVAFVVALALSPPARADGDPASDVLLAQKVFLPYASGISAGDKAALTSVVDQANARGLTVRVAVIASQYDLGSVTVLWRKPRTYAKFLGGEVKFVYKTGLLVTVMPNGFGLYRGTPAEQRILNRFKTGSSADELVKAATSGVEALGAAQGIKLVPHIPKSGSSSWRRIVIIAGGVLILGVLCLITYLYWRGPPEAERSEDAL